MDRERSLETDLEREWREVMVVVNNDFNFDEGYLQACTNFAKALLINNGSKVFCSFQSE